MLDTLRTDQQDRWRRGEPVRVRTYVERYPGLLSQPRLLADLIVGELELRKSHGENPDVEEYFAQFPQCANQLSHLCGGNGQGATIAVTQIAAAASTNDSDGSFDTIASDASGELASAAHAHHSGWPKIPGFEVLSELGRGGMGVVYKARQTAANRLVALKVVRRDVLEALPLETQTCTVGRFKHEAQATARLQHDNLVTVYEVGEVAGQWYYAMRFVEGQSLHEMLRAGPLDNRRAAGYLEPVGRALQAAHDQGILHRDLKPHNIMVDARSDRPLLADFGLAKFTDGSQELTRAGEVMGTPSYMPPEQTQDASRVTTLADVYSLGATLYHVLTGRAPFQAASLADTIRQINTVEPVAPRVLNPAIDRDLETICLKALQKEPARRYASAGALADDLSRYLEGRPILARPLGPVGRTWRWCRRNPWLATLSATAAGLALLALLSIIVGYVNTKAALAKSEARLRQALVVVDDLFTRLSEDDLLNEPGMQPLRKDLLARALKHYQFFLQESGGNPAVRDEAAAARFRVGMITQLTDSRKAALPELLAAADLQRQLLAERPDDIARLKALADTLQALGNVHKEERELDAATDYYQQTAAIRQRMTELAPTNREYARLLANTRMNLGMVELDRDELDAARAALGQAQTARQTLLAEDPRATKVRRDLAMGAFNFARLALVAGDSAAAATELAAAIRGFDELLAEDPRSLALRANLSVCHRLLAEIRADGGEIPAALASYEAAQRHMRTLAMGNPDVAQYQAELAILAMSRGTLCEEREDVAGAKTAWTEAHAALTTLVAREPKSPDYRRDLATSEWALGNLELDGGDRVAAIKLLSSARDRMQALAREFANDAALARRLAAIAADLAAVNMPGEKTP
ncbi:MAG: protein kinase [Pirellulaceae bacterium]|nr:protein kinase [Pirellulaceae bacterium]